MILVTLDTTELGDQYSPRLKEVLPPDAHVAVTSVSFRERKSANGILDCEFILESGVWGESTWGNFLWARPIREDLILGESPLGSAQLASRASGDMFEAVLAIIANGSFPAPGNRENLSTGHRHILRDAMIYSAHIREQRVLFITKDTRGFVNHGRRKRLQELGRTVIRSLEELEFLSEPNKFWDELRSLQAQLGRRLDEI